MSTQNLIRFQQSVAASPDLQQKLQAIQKDAGKEAAQKIVALSAEAGLPFTVEELVASLELSDEQLDSVAGGYEGSPYLGHLTIGGPVCNWR